MAERIDPEFTHKVTITLTSNGKADDVALKVVWDPDLEGQDIKTIGYLPAAYEFVQRWMLPTFEEAFMKSQENIPDPSKRH